MRAPNFTEDQADMMNRYIRSVGLKFHIPSFVHPAMRGICIGALLLFAICCVYPVGSAEWTEAYVDDVERAVETDQYQDTLTRALAEHPTDAYLNNLQGNRHYYHGHNELASRFYEVACRSTSYRQLGYVQNLVRSELLWDANAAVRSLVSALKSNRTDADLYDLLLRTVTGLLQEGRLGLPQFTKKVLLALPDRYELWLLLARARLPALLTVTLSVEENIEGADAALESEEEEALVVFGLSVFPSSPELLYLRALQYHLRARQLSEESDPKRCLRYFATAASAKGELWSSDMALLSDLGRALYFTSTAQPPASCTPLLVRHTVQSFQDIYRTISSLYEDGDRWHALGDILHAEDTSAPNSVTPSSVVVARFTADPTATRYLPSLQVGCSQYTTCALPGFLVADAMPAVSTHFLTQAYHLEMVEDASVGLVYSSHTLEHLSHNLPPARCSTHPKPDLSVVGCGSEVQEALREWRRVLAAGGQLLVSAPDLEALAAYFVHPDTSSAERAVLQAVLFGGQHNVYDFHKAGLFYALLQELLREAGFCDVRRVPEFGIFADTSGKVLSAGKPISVNVRATAC